MSSKHRTLWKSAGGSVPEHWQFKTIEELLEHAKSISVGVMYPGSDTEGGVPLIKVSDVKSGGIASQPQFCVSSEVDEEYKRTRLNGTELLITLVGNPGDCVVVTDEMAGWNVARALAVVRLKNNELRAWLRYVLLSKPAKHLIEARLNTTVQKTLNLKDIRELGIPIPPKNERENITKAIDAIEEKILLNRQTNQTLEHIAQAIFKSWFVDFEPTRAKIAAKEEWAKRSLTTKDGANDSALPYEQAEAIFIERAGMAAISGLSITDAAGAPLDELDQLSQEQQTQLKTTAALFPDELVDSELDEVPEGWELGELQEIAYFSTERIDRSELTVENYISTENMLEGKKGVSIASSFPAAKTVPKFVPGQILISNIRPYFMKIWLASFVGGRSNDVLGINAKEPSGIQYLYNLLYQDSFFNFMMTTSKGAKMPRGDKEAIMGWACVQPTLEIKKAYSEAVEKFRNIIENNNKENKTLEKIRDALLPKLLSGELSLKSNTTLEPEAC